MIFQFSLDGRANMATLLSSGLIGKGNPTLMKLMKGLQNELENPYSIHSPKSVLNFINRIENYRNIQYLYEPGKSKSMAKDSGINDVNEH